jgi:hypothetical protein
VPPISLIIDLVLEKMKGVMVGPFRLAIVDVATRA